MTDWATIAVILGLWPFEMLGVGYIVAWRLKKQIPDIIADLMKNPKIQEGAEQMLGFKWPWQKRKST